jgi:hypothetical protein
VALDEQVSTVDVYLQTPAGDVSFGRFSLQAGEVEGTDHRGITYRGTYTSASDGLDVELTASVPARTRITEGVATEAHAEQKLSFHLDGDQVAGQRSKTIVLDGFGAADVRFEPK